ncbi:hypothetical protein X801_01545 [Opisthorchis viverrini]|uniref:Origin recognition complex subunit 4 n=1 Tax=Opisthorchis viverrini TaxID=6198 RepID=A0A1S8X741_OPIVI|nr:hypothetical protein X801_01545 [Opisthorchis viverrini]
MDLIFHALRRRLYRSDHELLLFEDELFRLKQAIKTLVFDGESNSLLIIGRRGVGKKRAITCTSVKGLKKGQQHKRQPSGSPSEWLGSHLFIFTILGLIHTDDGSALRAMARQLHRESLLQSPSSEVPETDRIAGTKSLAFSQQLQWFLDGLHSGDGSSKSLLIVLHEFDLFASHRNQILLYNLFDCCQCNDTPICVIGLTCRLDIMELLEKRVKSRFSHRQIHLISIAAPLDHSSSRAVDNEGSQIAFDNYCLACEHLLQLNLDYVCGTAHNLATGKERRELDACVKSWNSHVRELLSDEIVIDTLRQAWSVSANLRRLTNLLVPIVAKLGGAKTRIDPVEFIDSLCILREDSKLNSLKGLCVLELFLIATLVKLQEIHEGRPVNFELLYAEYAKFCRSNCPGYLYDKPVVHKSLDNLIDLELVVAGKSAMAAAATAAASRGTSGQWAMHPNYKPLFCFVESQLLSACLDAYPNCPMELRFWIHSRAF